MSTTPTKPQQASAPSADIQSDGDCAPVECSDGVEDAISKSIDTDEFEVVPKKRMMEKLDAWFSRMSARNAMFNKMCSLIWLPYAFRSGISFRRLDEKTFTAKLPFRRFNRNWYNAMAGAALLGNSEVAAGMFLFAECGSEYIVICKSMRYRFLRPCFGPAIYKVVNSEDLQSKVREGGEFNIELEMVITQQVRKPRQKEHRVGRCTTTFHCTPKPMYYKRRRKRAQPRTTNSS